MQSSPKKLSISLVGIVGLLLVLFFFTYLFHSNTAQAQATGTAVTSFQLTSGVTGTEPFTVGLAFKDGDIPSNPVLSISNSQVIVKTRWNDGSVKMAIASGETPLTAGVPQTITVFASSSAPGGTPLTASDIQAANPAATVSLGSYGSVSLSNLLATPFRTWISGPEMVEADYRSPVGSDPTLQVWFYVRLYKSGRIWIRTSVENGYLDIPTVNKTYAPTVTIGGNVVYSASTLTQYMHTGWTATGWIGGDPQIIPTFNTTYLMSTRLVPNYLVQTPSASTLNNLYQVYTPMDQGMWSRRMGNTGYQPDIGILPLWDALYLTSGGAPQAYKSVLANAEALHSYSIIWPDSVTKEPVMPSNRPFWTFLGENKGGGLPSIGGNPLVWDSAHHPEGGYLPYILTGDHYYLETMEDQADMCYLWTNGFYSGGSGTTRMIKLQTRGTAWCYRTIGQLAGIGPTGDPIVNDFKTLLYNNGVYWDNLIQSPGMNPLGIFYSYEIGAYGVGKISPWQQNFLTQVYGYVSDLQPFSDMTAWNAGRDYLYKSIVGLLGGSGTNNFCYTGATNYTLTVSNVSSPDPRAWYTSWGTVYQNTFGVPNTSCGTTLLGSSGGNPGSAYGGFWGNLMPAIAYAVDDGAPGAAASWTRLINASNWSAVLNSGFGDVPQWGIVPRGYVPGTLPPPPPPSSSQPPAVSFSASPSTITSSAGTSSTLTWNATNATSCTGTGFSTSGAVFGSVSVSPITTTTYSINCTGTAGSANKSVTIVVGATSTPAPTVTLFSSVSSLTSGQTTSLVWSSTNATSCVGTGFIAGGPSGTVTVSPNVTTNYAVTCTGAGGNATKTTTITVTAAPVAQIQDLSLAGASDFSQTNNCTNVLEGQSCTISITFKPTVAGTRTSTLSFFDVAAGMTKSIPLTGTGVAVVVSAPVAGSCGTANGVAYTYGSTNYNPNTQCANGTPSTTAFPAAGSATTWTCSGTNGGATSRTCSASQNAAGTSSALSSVTGIQAITHDGQTFITWNDLAPGAAGQQYRYAVYRSTSPITQANLDSAQLIANNLMNNSGQLFGDAPFLPSTRIDPTQPMSTIQNGGTPLPLWTGLDVYTAKANQSAYYAVVATDSSLTTKPTSPVVAGLSATTQPIAEVPVSTLQPIKIYDSTQRPTYVPQTKITGTPNLPLMLYLHASSAQGGGASAWGDYYLYFGNDTMGYQPGIPGVFSVEEDKPATGNYLMLKPRDTVWKKDGSAGLETYWFGYVAKLLGNETLPERAYPVTENRLLWMTNWAINHYHADPNRVYASGTSMGAWGSVSFAYHHPEIFTAVFPAMPRFQQVTYVPSINAGGNVAITATYPIMGDNVTPYKDYANTLAYASAHHTDLPFIGWVIGRNDGYATWKEQVDMVNILKANKQGFAFAWNNGHHGTEPDINQTIMKYYGWNLKKNQSYPAFENSSIDNNPGNGDPLNGDLTGSINLGFIWNNVVDTKSEWSVTVSNDMIVNPSMTVDITPRRVQQFKPAPGEIITWTNSAGGSGQVVTDTYGLVTVPNVIIKNGQASVLTLTRSSVAQNTSRTSFLASIATLPSSVFSFILNELHAFFSAVTAALEQIYTFLTGARLAQPAAVILSLKSSSLNFGSVPVGQSATQTITLTMSGSAQTPPQTGNQNQNPTPPQPQSQNPNQAPAYGSSGSNSAPTYSSGGSSPTPPQSQNSNQTPTYSSGGYSPTPTQTSSSNAQTSNQPQTQNAPSVSISHILFLGKEGSEVRALQTYLVAQGLLAPDFVTGFYGPLTRAAVERYQCNHNIVCGGNESTTGYGVVGPKTLQILTGTAPASVSSPAPAPTSTTSSGLTMFLYFGLKNQQVSILQSILIADGFLAPGKNTGFFGFLTSAAVKRFQCSRNVVCTGDESTTGWGLVGPKTRRALGGQ